MKSLTQIAEVSPMDLVPAGWNYKLKGTEEEISKLSKSIELDRSAGVLAVREIEKDGERKLEVIDGNHRLEAIKLLGWDKIPVENFGEISLAQAVIIARRRNHSWFEDDKMQLAKLFNEEVYKEFKIEELVEFMPDSLEALEGYTNLAEFDWTPPESNNGDGDSFTGSKINLTVPEDTYNLWMKWRIRLKDNLGIEDQNKAFEFAVIEALNVPEDKLS